MYFKIIDSEDKVTIINEGPISSLHPTEDIKAYIYNNTLIISNKGNPDNFGSYNYVPFIFYFKSIEAFEVPANHNPSLYPFDLSYKTGDKWVIVSENAYKHKHKRYPKSSNFHMLEGGDTFMVRFVHAGNPSNPVFANTDSVKSLLGLDADLLNNAYIKRILGFYNFNLDSLNPNAVNKNFGWRMIPQNFVKRYTSISQDFVSGWYGFGGTHSAGEGFSNEHYDHVLWWFVNYLVNNNKSAYDIGIEMLKKKICYGLINCNNNILWKGWWRGEKGDRRGDLMPPASAKEWDTGLIVGYLLSGDPIFKAAMDLRLSSLLGRSNANIWNGAGGGRMLGNYLSCLLSYYKLTQNIYSDQMTLIKNKAQSFMNHVFTNHVKGLDYFPNVYLKDSSPVWEEATAYRYTYEWAKILGNQQQYTKVKTMIQWLIDKGSGYVAPGIYGVAKDIILSSGYKSFTTPNTAAWWVPIWKIAKQEWPGVYDSIADNCTNTMYNNIGSNWQDITSGKTPLAPDKIHVDLGAYGASAEKQWPILLSPIVSL